MGRAPLHATCALASATGVHRATRGLSWHQRPLPSVGKRERALHRARFRILDAYDSGIARAGAG